MANDQKTTKEEQTPFISKFDTFFAGLSKELGFSEKNHGQESKGPEKMGYIALAFDTTGKDGAMQGFASVAADSESIVLMLTKLLSGNPELAPMFEEAIYRAKIKADPMAALFEKLDRVFGVDKDERRRASNPIEEILRELSDNCPCPRCTAKRQQRN